MIDRDEDLFPPLPHPIPLTAPPAGATSCPDLLTPRYYAKKRTKFATRLKVAIPTENHLPSITVSCGLAEQIIHEDSADGTPDMIWEPGMEHGYPVACVAYLYY